MKAFGAEIDGDTTVIRHPDDAETASEVLLAQLGKSAVRWLLSRTILGRGLQCVCTMLHTMAHDRLPTLIPTGRMEFHSTQIIEGYLAIQCGAQYVAPLYSLCLRNS